MSSVFNRISEAFKDWLARRLPDCKDITPTIGESLDRRLNWREQLVMKLHLFTCGPCTRYLTHLGFMKEALQHNDDAIADPGSGTGPELREDVKDRIKQRLARVASS